jgi:transcriptional regulator with XRE-family HTH domain
MSATLGGLIKDYRLQKNMSQLDIAFALGWKESSQLSRIEQGRVEKPGKKLVESLANIMELKPSEKNDLLLAGSYLPTEKEIEEIREQAAPIIENWNYPAYILDFSWRMICYNKEAAWVYDLDSNAKKQIYKNHPRTLEVVFDKDFIQNKYAKGKELEKWHQFLHAKIVLFKYAQRTRTKESWYIKHVRELMKQNKLFREIWASAKLPESEVGLADYERKTLINMRDKSKNLEFHLFKNSFLQDPRFEVNFHVPDNKDTFNAFS